MNQRSHDTFTARDLEEARAQGTLAGEVRVLKWGAGLALAAILGALGLLYQNQIVLHERVARVDERVVRVEGRLDVIEKQLATISAQLTTLTSNQNASQ